ncbi:hypothetical protein [Streptomyces sp. NPDC058424]|uniref:hypothetical protein n=1 Tax=Streptomyces sp. NPDC058424 TaxID=3346491 RepID=UPI003664AEF9
MPGLLPDTPPANLCDPGDLAPSTPVTDRELELAEALIRELTGINVGEVHDDYVHALE